MAKIISDTIKNDKLESLTRRAEEDFKLEEDLETLPRILIKQQGGLPPFKE